ncbi:hypothetical protein [Kitasatospora sp. Root107]|uniref:hypothetical protein n=1 Tax=Kitasatospora sp. Root107 TaxID=1736424 RepID=UPI00070DD656|nr:hypothetical protein [Kitasatospora sp. Root107]KQV16619.1 hypothetical protein ASC99_28000 [Kitasatospora sp. Root107]
MAYARCDFYTPKASTESQLLEAKANLQRMLVSIPLTEYERAAVDDGQSALDRLLERLAEVATSAGPTPTELRAEPDRPLPLTVRSPSDPIDRKGC